MTEQNWKISKPGNGVERLQQEQRAVLAHVVDLRADNARLRAALRLFVDCAYPVAIEVNPRGHNWLPEKSLDYALDKARRAMESKP